MASLASIAALGGALAEREAQRRSSGPAAGPAARAACCGAARVPSRRQGARAAAARHAPPALSARAQRRGGLGPTSLRASADDASYAAPAPGDADADGGLQYYRGEPAEGEPAGERGEEEEAGLEGFDDGAPVEKTAIQAFLYPEPEDLPDDVEMSIWEHLDELRERVLVAAAASGISILGCFTVARQLVIFLEQPVAEHGVRFLQLSPGEYFFTTLKVSGYAGLLITMPVILYEAISYILPGLTRSERKFLGPIVFGSSILFFSGIAFSYGVLAPAALNFFVNYAADAVESIWSIDQYFEFVLVLMLSTGLSFQVPVIQFLLGQLRIVNSTQMLSAWRYVVVGAVVAGAVLTPSTDPLTQMLLAAPLVGLYMGGALAVKLTEPKEGEEAAGAA